MKVIALPILLLLLVLIIFLWPKKQAFPIKYYLPVNTSFYLHLKEANWLLEGQDKADFIDNKAIFDLWQSQKNIWGPYYINIQELVWFKTDQNFAADSFLLRFSALPDKDYLKSLEKSFPDYNFYKLDKHILLVSKFLEKDIVFRQEVLAPEDIYFFSEAIIYLQKGKLPEFLTPLGELIEPILEGQSLFIGIDKSKRQINILAASQNDASVKENDFSSLLLPKYLDLGFGFSSQLLEEHKKTISQGLLVNNFISLPYNTLGLDYREGLLLDKKAIFEQEDHWLIVFLGDFDQEILQFLNIFKVKEVYRTLVDGTGYYELLADDEEIGKEYELLGLKYRQIGNLYALEHNNYHYLSNSEGIIKDVISQPRKISDLLSCGNMEGKQIKDFIVINTDKLDSKFTKDYLLSKGILNFKAFSYEIDNFMGISLCY